MTIESWIVTLALAFIASVVTVVIRFIRLETKFSMHKHVELEKVASLEIVIQSIVERLKEDRTANTTDHNEFYQFMRITEPMQAEILQQLTGIVDTQSRILKEIYDLRNEVYNAGKKDSTNGHQGK